MVDRPPWPPVLGGGGIVAVGCLQQEELWQVGRKQPLGVGCSVVPHQPCAPFRTGGHVIHFVRPLLRTASNGATVKTDSFVLVAAKASRLNSLLPPSLAHTVVCATWWKNGCRAGISESGRLSDFRSRACASLAAGPPANLTSSPTLDAYPHSRLPTAVPSPETRSFHHLPPPSPPLYQLLSPSTPRPPYPPPL
jgi:hypothetical protein